LGEFRNAPLAVLADLNLPIYITTNYDHFVEKALETRGGKHPISDFCRWNEDLVDYANEEKINPELYDPVSGLEITSSNPLVYHLYGDIKHPKSMVLTEKDYIDFIIFLNKEDEKRLYPHAIKRLKNEAELLFVGYTLDKGFMTIFQTVMSSGGSDDMNGISVQLISTPASSDTDPAKAEAYLEEYTAKAEAYLEEYTRHMMRLHVYWGDVFKFSEELRYQLDNFVDL
jgi:hypothetical protein